MFVTLENPTTHQLKQAKVGFSWTTFFFGFWPALFRGDWKWFGIILVIEIFVGCISYGIAVPFVAIIFSFIYNKLYINDLLSSGYVPSDDSSKKTLLAKGFIVNK